MSDCKVSIVMPVYNVEKYLQNCLDSVVQQTLKEIEVIVVNDGSTDHSLSILKEYEEKYKGLIRVYSTINSGVSHARNYGIERARGEYLLFVDSDDFIEPDMCEMLYDKAVKNNNDIVICKYFDVYENEATGQITRKKGKAYDIAIGRNFNIHDTRFELTHISPFPWDKLYRRSLFEHHKFPEKMRFEDLALIFQVVCDAKSIGVIEDRLYNYRRGSQGSFLSSFSEGTLDIIKALKLMVEGLKEKNHLEEFMEEIEYICIRHILIRFNAIYDVKQRGKLDVKLKMIQESCDFFEEYFPNWRENRYLNYSASKATKVMAMKCSSRSKMLSMAREREYVPMVVYRLLKKLKKIKNQVFGRIKRFLKARNKRQYLRNRIPGIKLVKLPKDVKYTRYYETLSVNEYDILFESKHGEDIAGNIFQMLLSMGAEQYRKFHVILTLREDLILQYVKLLDRYGIDYVDIVITDSKEYLKTLASAKYLITDTSFPPYYIKKPEQVYLNTWHGTPLKGMGRVVPMREYGLGNVQRNFFLSDYLLYQNKFSRDVFLKDYMLEPIYQGKIMLSGYPRNSAFFKTDRYEQIREEMELEDMQVMVYMPTWRGRLDKKENKKQISMLYNYFYELDSSLMENQILYVKLHPFVKSQLNYDDFSHIFAFPEEYETYDFLNASDLLITDYSSIMFDYAVSKKPIVLFTYDRMEYLSERGMYLDLNQVEFPVADTVAQLVKAIHKNVPYPKFFKEFCSLDSQKTSDEVCRALIFGEKPSFEIETLINAKKNVLIFISGMKNNDTTDQLIQRLNTLDTTEYNYYLCMKTNTVKKATSRLSELKEEIRYIPLVFDVNYTIRDRIACIWNFKLGLRSKYTDGLILRLAKREKEKYFGNIPFDTVINFSVTDKIIFHMMEFFSGRKIYNFKSFDAVKYQENRSYRSFIDYFAKRFHVFDLIVGTKQIEKANIRTMQNEKVPMLIEDNPRFDFHTALERVHQSNREERGL